MFGTGVAQEIGKQKVSSPLGIERAHLSGKTQQIFSISTRKYSSFKNAHWPQVREARLAVRSTLQEVSFAQETVLSGEQQKKVGHL
jgi:hypothetical protein